MNASHTPARIGRIGHLFVLMVAVFITQLTACGGSGSDSGLVLPVVRPFALTYSNGSVVYVTGQPIIDNRPSVRGGPVDSYTIQPPLPSGLRINPQSGVIRGTPASPSPATIYTVTASNLAGSTVGRVQIEVSDVVIAPGSLRYPQESAIYTTGQQIPPNIPVTTGGEITQFTVDPSLPSGLSLDPQTGVITGTPTAQQPTTQYTVTGANSAGDVQANISIAVQQPAVEPPPVVTTPPPIITLPPTVVPPATVSYEDAVYVVGQPIVPNVPTLTGGPPTQFAVSPGLPDGLTLDTTTGVISGAPTTLQFATPYAVTASNSAGQAQTTLTLAVTRVGTWRPSGNLNTRRDGYTASLSPDTKVLVAGGFNTGTDKAVHALNSAEIRSQAGIWTTAPAMTASRLFHTSTALQDGRVLVVGGVDSGGNTRNAVEIFDGMAWSPAASMAIARYIHTATLLKTGKVLVAGGVNGINSTATAELYDATSNTWTLVGLLHSARAGHTATLLADGRVLVAGGEGASGMLASAEIYDPGTQSWTEVAPMSQARISHAASLLPDGSVLVMGGNSASGVPTDQAELFDPGSMSWQQLPPMKIRRKTHTATTMLNGQVVVAGGTGLIIDSLRSVEIFDPGTRQWLPAASMAVGRNAHTATLLLDGRLLVTSGQDGSSELFDIGH